MAALSGGCIFSPHKDDDPPKPKPPVVYPPRNTPQNAVLFLTVAWANRDSVQIDSLYADEYTGSSIDLTESNPENLSFVKSDEVRSVGAMALSTSIVTVSMDFGLQQGWLEGSYATDPPEWRWVQIPSANIYINDGVKGEYRAQYPEAGNTWIFEFTLKPTYPNGPSEQPVWQIVRWVETRDENGGGGP